MKCNTLPLAAVLITTSLYCFSQTSHKLNTQTDQTNPFDQYVQQASEFSSRARANVYFPNPQSIFLGAQFNFVNTGSGSLTFLRRDMVVSGRIPLIVARVYDSSSKGTVDFGPGWRLSAAETISVSGNKAQLATENGSIITFVRTQAGFQMEKDYPSDYLSLVKTAPDTFQASLRSGFVKEFTRMEHEFRLAKVIDRNGNEIRLLYKNGLLSQMENVNHWITFTRNKNGCIVSVHDDQGRKVGYSYDDAARLVQVTDLGGNSWQYAYTEAGMLKTATDPLQRVNFAVVYEDSGRVSRLQLPSGEIQYSYDPAARSTTVIDRKHLTSRFFHNEDGITIKVVNALGEETAVGLDAARNVISLARNGSVIEKMGYDEQHRILVRHSFSDAGILDRHYSYDPVTGLLAGIQESNGNNQSFGYDTKGNLTVATLADGTHKFGYSQTGDLLSVSIPNSSMALTTDPDGLIASLKDDKGAITSFQYRASGELAQAIFPNRSEANYSYQPSGLRSKLTYQDGRQLQYSYDPAGNLTGTKVFDSKGKQVNGQALEMNDSYQLTRWIRSDAPETTFQYDANGNLAEIKKGDSTTGFEYDELNRLIAVIAPDGQRLTYNYQPGERSLIEQYEHASVLVTDLRDTGLTFTHPLSATASRPLTAPYGTVRFSESLGTFQLANADGSEIVLPHENIKGALAKLHLVTQHLPANATAQDKQNAFNVPFNTMFMPGEYLTINCCPSCCTDPDQVCFVKSCPCHPVIPAPTLTSINPSGAYANVASFGVTLYGSFNDATEQVNITPAGITASNATNNLDGTASTSFQLSSSITAGNYSVSVSDTGGQSNSVTFAVLPVITSILPAQGLVGAAQNITINGAGFASGATINAGSNISVSNVSVKSSTQITATFTPANSTSAGGNQNVTVTVNGQTANSASFYVQIPSSVNVVSISTIADGSPGGCTASMDFGIEIDIKYQVLDQESPAQPIRSSNMTPFEDDTFPGPVTASGDICANSPVADCTLNTASDGSFHDAPVGACNSVVLSNYTETQVMSMLVGTGKYTVRTNNYIINSSSSGHGTITNGGDINVTR